MCPGYQHSIGIVDHKADTNNAGHGESQTTGKRCELDIEIRNRYLTRNIELVKMFLGTAKIKDLFGFGCCNHLQQIFDKLLQNQQTFIQGVQGVDDCCKKAMIYSAESRVT
uniref:Uncharacterized protein n=1 Tax=Romanomermis culicivorax TaxID=13658 RepID=A0A915J998_ROMCU